VPRFTLKHVLGRGGFGTVYAARETTSGLLSAIKVTRPDVPSAKEQLRREVHALRAVGPPHVPKVFASGELSDGASYAAFELIAAPTLAEKMELEKLPFELPTFGNCADAILTSVDAIHRRGFVHCDLKPENILIEDSPLRARLVDFGLVRAAGRRTQGDNTGAGAAPGSPDYMSPEQCRNSSKIGVAADIYALGIVFFEMLTGRIPFFGKPADVQEAHRSRRPPRLGELAPTAVALEGVILRCLAKKPSDRFSCIAALRLALQDALNAPVTSAPKKRARVESQPPKSRSREKRSVAMAFFHSAEDAGQVNSTLKSLGGHLAHAAASAFVGVFSSESGDNPVNRTLIAARTLLRRGSCQRAMVDVATVTVQTRTDGERQYFSPLFSRSDRYPLPSDPDGAFVTEAAAKVLKDVRGTSLQEHRSGVLRLVDSEGDADPGPITSKLIGPLVGRDDVLQLLCDRAGAAVNSRTPTICTVIAEPGHGKTHLYVALGEELKKIAGAQVIQLRAREPSAGDANQTIREMLLKLLKIQGGSCSKEAGRRLLVEQLGNELATEVWPGAALALGVVSLDSTELRPFAAAPGALRSGAARAAGAAMRRWAQGAPLLFILDDAQFTDEAALDALEYATLAEEHSPIWVCVLSRPSFEAARPSWAERCAERSRVVLGPLAQDGASALCRSLLAPAENVPAAAIQLLVERTQGVPIQIVELVRALKDRGLVRQNSRTGTSYLATDELGVIPDLPLVEWLAARELESLPQDLAAHARLAALLGADFVPEEIAGVLAELERDGGAGSFPLDASVATQWLLTRGVLVERRRDQLTFRHALVRDAVYKSAPESMRRPIHQAAFRFYGDGCLLPPHQRLSRLAFHAAQSGRADVASDCYFALAEQAQSRHAYLDAESMYTRALEQIAPEASPRRLAVFRGRALMRYRLSRYEDACQDFELAREVAHQLGDLESEVEILLDEATALDWADEYRRSKELVERADLMARDHQSPLIEARILMGLARSCVRFNSYERAAELYNLAADKAEQLGDAAYETYVISLLHNGYVLASLGRLDESENAFNRVIPLCEQRGDKLHLGAAVGNRFMLWTCRNEEDKLLADLHRLLQICREMGNGRMEQQAHFYLGLFLRWLDELGEAEKHARRAMEIDKTRLGEAARAESALLLARVLAAANNAKGARDILDQIQARRALAQERKDKEFEFLPGEQIFFSMVDLATREATENEWELLQARALKCLTGQDLLEFLEMRGRAAQRGQARDAAVRAFKAAVALAAQVPNVMLKRLESELAALTSPGK